MKISFMRFFIVCLFVFFSHGAAANNGVVVGKSIVDIGPAKNSNKLAVGFVGEPKVQDQNVEVFTMENTRVNATNNDSNELAVWRIELGLFNQNLERLASEFGFSPVIWDERVKNCVWEQVTEYDIPSKFVEPRDVLAFYASTLDFKPVYSEVDTSVQLIYVGALSRIQDCQND